MRIGIPKETLLEEKRVALAPAGVNDLVKAGHSVYIQSEAGLESHFTDEEYRNVGAQIVYNHEEIYQRSELIAKISPLTLEEADLLEEEQIVFSFLHLAVGNQKIVEKLLEKRVTAISYELIEKDSEFPVLKAISEIAGQLAVHYGERFLLSDFKNSRGILMGGLAGVAPAAVVILGAGTVGLNAARTAIGIGAQVIMLDRDSRALRRAENILGKHITTVAANEYTISRGVKFADVLIGAIHQPEGGKTNYIVTEEMVKSMKKGSVIIDVSIDFGGSIETSYPTTISEPTYTKYGVIHFCVPNMTALVSRTASYALTNSSSEFIQKIADNGLANALLGDEGLAKGVCIYSGTCSNKIIADIFNLEYRRLHIFSNN